MENIFQLKTNGISIKNPIALSAMAGITDSRFAASHAKNAGLAVIGAYNLDPESVKAGKEAAARGRTEFDAGEETEEILNHIQKEIQTLKKEMPDTAVAVSVRSATLEPLIKAAKRIRQENAILELDVHCRQPEFTEKGMGQSLLKEPEKLAETIQKIKETNVTLSVKFRTSVVDPKTAAEFFDAAGADILHADAMIEGKGSDPEAISMIRNATKKLLIANNSVDDFDAALNFYSSGADLVSVARAAADDPRFLPHLAEEITKYQKETGWYNAPKHVCKQGDNRGLAFCCPPVKHCALLRKIESVGFTPEEFIKIKQDAAKGTPLEGGKETCFGSFVWCCKGTKPCYYREESLSRHGITQDEYMRMKHELAEKIQTAIEEKKTAAMK